MFKKFFSKEKKKSISDNILICSLLVHAAKIDENYTDFEKKIIKKALIDLKLVEINNEEVVEKLLKEHNVSANYFQNELTW